MPSFVSILAFCGLAAAGVTLGKARAVVRGTTLIAAWWCGGGALVCGLFAGVSTASGLLPPELAGHVWYLVAVVSLCPFVMVLGARRPIDCAWPAFVLLPLVLVLGLPSVSTLSRGIHSPLQVETPTVLGFAVVLLMGVGNYLFTRFAWPALLLGAATVLLVFPSTEFAANTPPADCVPFAGIALGLAAAAALWQTRTRPDELPPHERLWSGFRNAYGVVWAKRVMDRVNWTATEEDWPLRLDLFGVIWTTANATGEQRDHALRRLRATFDWLLKRFVDDRWIAERAEE